MEVLNSGLTHPRPDSFTSHASTAPSEASSFTPPPSPMAYGRADRASFEQLHRSLSTRISRQEANAANQELMLQLHQIVTADVHAGVPAQQTAQKIEARFTTRRNLRNFMPLQELECRRQLDAILSKAETHERSQAKIGNTRAVMNYAFCGLGSMLNTKAALVRADRNAELRRMLTTEHTNFN